MKKIQRKAKQENEKNCDKVDKNEADIKQDNISSDHSKFNTKKVAVTCSIVTAGMSHFATATINLLAYSNVWFTFLSRVLVKTFEECKHSHSGTRTTRQV